MSKHKEEGGMGFRRIQQVNMALLAKTGWSILTQPEILVSWVLKSKYYHRSEFLTAGEGSNPNFIWRSLCTSKYLLQKGCVKRIGNGLDTRIFMDPWLPVGQSTFIHSTPNEDLSESRVADIIDWDTRIWNTHKLETFSPLMK